jgi:Leucine-rich repeat (LRR) protein
VKAVELRCLNVSWNHYLKSLPKGLGKLPNLETVDLRGCYLERLPPGCSRVALGWRRF